MSILECWACRRVFTTIRSRAAHERWHGPAPEGIASERARLRNRRILEKQRATGYLTPWRKFVLNANERAARLGLPGRLTFANELPLGPCHYCGGPSYSWDHVNPLIAGGPNAVTNLVPACQACNERKGSRAAADVPWDHPVFVSLRCGWCWKPGVKRRYGDLVRLSQVRGREHSVFCSKACQYAHRAFVMAVIRPPYSLAARKAS